MTTDHTDAAVRILIKTVRKLTAQLAEADHMASVRTSMLADTMTELDEERKASHSTALSVAAGLNERLQSCIDDAMNALTADFDADTRAGDALAILRGEA